MAHINLCSSWVETAVADFADIILHAVCAFASLHDDGHQSGLLASVLAAAAHAFDGEYVSPTAELLRGAVR